MTKNQIELAKLQETMRAQREQERLTGTRDQAARVLGINQLAEASRHNRAVELVESGKLGETSRANLAKEAETKRSNLAKEEETQRHQKAAEAIDIGKTAAKAASDAATLAERVRSNMARESETATHNRAMELKDVSPKVTVTSTSSPVHVSSPIQIGIEGTRTSPGVPSWENTGRMDPGFDPGIGKGVYQDYWQRSSDGRTRIMRRYVNGRIEYIEE